MTKEMYVSALFYKKNRNVRICISYISMAPNCQPTLNFGARMNGAIWYYVFTYFEMSIRCFHLCENKCISNDEKLICVFIIIQL